MTSFISPASALARLRHASSVAALTLVTMLTTTMSALAVDTAQLNIVLGAPVATGGGSYDVQVIVNNPTNVPIIAVRSFLEFDPMQLAFDGWDAGPSMTVVSEPDPQPGVVSMSTYYGGATVASMVVGTAHFTAQPGGSSTVAFLDNTDGSVATSQPYTKVEILNSSTFTNSLNQTTGIGDPVTIDAAPPTLVASTPTDGAAGVNESDNLSATFSEAIDTAAAAGGITLVRVSDGATIAGSLVWSAGDTVATINPTAALDFSTGYRVDVSAAVADLAGNAMTATSFAFTTRSQLDVDDDADGLPDVWENANFGNLSQTAAGDPDSDGLTNAAEYAAGTDPNLADTDGDGISDSQEQTNGTDPTVAADLDGDGLFDDWETHYFGDPTAVSATSDADSDGSLDVTEIANGTDPSNPDSDSDGLNDGDEATAGTDPLAADSDSDGLDDGAEIAAGTDPLDSDSDNDGFLDGADPAPLDPAIPDVTAPTIASTSPSDGATDVATGATVSVTFSETMDAGTTTAGKFVLKNSGGATISASFALAGATVTITPSVALDYTETYTLTIAGTVADSAGNPLGSAAAISFATENPPWDTDADGLPDVWENTNFGNLSQTAAGDPDSDGLTNAAEYAAGTDPTAADTDGDSVPDATEISNGTDPLAADSDSDGLDDGAEIAAGTDPLDSDSDNDTVLDGAEVAAGTNPLLADTDADGLDDATELAGPTDPTNPDSDNDTVLDGADPAPLDPAIPDLSIPTIASSSPTDGATAVSTGATISVTFSETMSGTTTTAGDFVLTDGSGSPVAASFALAGATVTIDPTAVLAYGETYDLAIAATVSDLSGNALGAPATISFTTEAEPAATLTAVSISSNNPTRSLAIPGDTATLTFAADRDLQNVSATIEGQAATVTPIDARNFTASAVLPGTLADGPVAFAISFENLSGLAGGPVSATTDASAVTFDKTAPTAPVVSATTTTPTTDTTPSWSWTAAGGGIGTFRFKLDDADLTVGATETGATAVTADSALGEGGHTLYVQERDAAGNWSTAGSAAVTIDLTAPTISGTTPADGATAVALATQPTVTFSENLDPATVIAANFSINNAASISSVSYDAPTRIATLTLGGVAGQTTYTVTAATALADLAGNPLGGTRSFGFTTADVGAPTIASSSPTDGATDVATGATLSVTFSENMSGATTTAGDFVLVSATGTTVPAGFSLAGATATVTPTQPLAYGTGYALTVAATVSDLTGNALGAPVTISFTTANPADDTDGDGLPDAWEIANFGDLAQTPAGDSDADGLSNLAEYAAGTDPTAADSDGDSVPDATEISNGTDPLAADSDSDGLNDGAEAAAGTDPLDPDTDHDGTPDGSDADPLDPTVGGAFAITARTPLDGATGVATGSPVQISFDQNLDPATVTADSVRLVLASVPVAATRAVSGSGVTLTPDAALAAGVTYSVEVSTAVHSAVGTPLGSAASWTFTTAVDPADTDSDGLLDAWEIANFGSLAQTADADPDADGLTNSQEQILGTDPDAADSDGDGTSDGAEITAGTDPTGPGTGVDSDADSLPDWWEMLFLGNLSSDGNADPDADGVINLTEYGRGLDPTVADSDLDGLSDGAEIAAGTDPTDPDSDDDGLLDGVDPVPLDPVHGAPQTVSATSVSKNLIRVSFSEPITTAESALPGSFSVAGLTVYQAYFDPADATDSTVLLITSDQASGASYAVTAGATIIDSIGTAIDPTAATGTATPGVTESITKSNFNGDTYVDPADGQTKPLVDFLDFTILMRWLF